MKWHQKWGLTWANSDLLAELDGLELGSLRIEFPATANLEDLTDYVPFQARRNTFSSASLEIKHLLAQAIPNYRKRNNAFSRFII